MWLIASDLHFTDAPRDAYRFGIFDFLIEQAVAHKATDIFLLGDITDRKDNHSGAFINAVYRQFIRLYDMTQARIHILQGNHDYTDPENPTLCFLDNIKGVDLHWHGRAGDNVIGAAKSHQSVVMMPFARSEDDFKQTLELIPSDVNFVAAFFHQTFHGAKASSGMEMGGFPVELAHRINAKRYFSGDIHVPQVVGKVEYVGSPYQIRFGDDFQGRVIAYDPAKDEMKSLHFDTIRKRTLTITNPKELAHAHARIYEGDQIKIRMTLPHEKTREWKTIEAEIVAAVKAAGADLYGVELSISGGDNNTAELRSESTAPAQVFDDYCASNDVDAELKQAGEKYL